MSHQVGDVVNGHILGSDNQWHPVENAPEPPAPAPSQDVKPPGTSKPFYRRWWLIAAVVLLIIILISATRGGSSSQTSTTPAAPSAQQSAAPAEAAVAGLNTPVRDGDFEFTVTGMECGKTQVGSQYLNKAAQGQFCLVSVAVTNIGKEPQLFSVSDQKAIDAQGRKLEADSSALVYIEESKAILANINPGNTVKGVVVYDIPKTSQIVQLELHDSMFSTGVKAKVA